MLERSNVVQVIARCDSPKALLESVAKFSPQVVVLNADRPGCNLAELCRTLTREHKVGIVLISTESVRGPVRDALEAGAHSIISSPFHPRDLILAVVHASNPSLVQMNLEILSSVEQTMKQNSDLATGSLNRLMEWASRPAAEEISPRLKHTSMLNPDIAKPQ